jgi:hypothetical protein
MTSLIPNPPLGEFPALPDNLRWRIEKPSRNEGEEFRPLRRVYIERRETTKNWLGRERIVWNTVLWGVWPVEDGLGDFGLVEIGKWYKTNGLASAIGHLFYQLNKPEPERHLDIYGVSKV